MLILIISFSLTPQIYFLSIQPSKSPSETKHQSILHFSKKTIFPFPISPITLPPKVFNNLIFLLSFDITMPVLIPDIKLL